MVFHTLEGEATATPKFSSIISLTQKLLNFKEYNVSRRSEIEIKLFLKRLSKVTRLNTSVGHFLRSPSVQRIIRNHRNKCARISACDVVFFLPFQFGKETLPSCTFGCIKYTCNLSSKYKYNEASFRTHKLYNDRYKIPMIALSRG